MQHSRTVFASLTLFVALFLQALPPTNASGPTQINRQTAAPTGPSDQNATEERQTTVTTVQTNQFNQSETNSSSKPTKTDDYATNWVNEVAAYSTLAIAFFTLVTIGVFVFQIQITRDVERAWITAFVEKAPDTIEWVDAPKGSSWLVAYSFQNHGRTPAKIESIRGSFRWVAKLSDLPDEPDYSICDNIEDIPTDGVLVVPTHQFPVHIPFAGEGGSKSVTQTQLDAVRRKEAFFVCYGTVLYRDAFQRQHQTRFCHLWESTGTKPPYGGWFRTGGPAKYNKSS